MLGWEWARPVCVGASEQLQQRRAGEAGREERTLVNGSALGPLLPHGLRSLRAPAPLRPAQP